MTKKGHNLRNRTLKCVVVGDEEVGKTELIRAIKDDLRTKVDAVVDADELLEDRISTNIDGEPVTIVFWNAAGVERYDTVRVRFHKDTDIFIVCYAVNNRESFDNVVHKWLPELSTYGGKHTPVMLIGNKVDLRKKGKKAEKSVSYMEGLMLAKAIKAISFFEVCAKTLYGIKEGFDPAVRIALQWKINRWARKPMGRSKAGGGWKSDKYRVPYVIGRGPVIKAKSIVEHTTPGVSEQKQQSNQQLPSGSSTSNSSISQRVETMDIPNNSIKISQNDAFLIEIFLPYTFKLPAMVGELVSEIQRRLSASGITIRLHSNLFGEEYTTRMIQATKDAKAVLLMLTEEYMWNASVQRMINTSLNRIRSSKVIPVVLDENITSDEKYLEDLWENIEPQKLIDMSTQSKIQSSFDYLINSIHNL